MRIVHDGALLAPADCEDEFERRGRRRVLYGAAWLVFLAFPLIDALRSRETAAGRALTVLAAAAFVGIYLVQLFGRRRAIPDRLGLLMVGTQLVIAVTLTLADRPSWATLFIFTVAGAAVVLRAPLRGVALVLCAVLTPLTGSLAGDRAGDVIAYTATAIGIGMLMLALADLRARNQELSAARAELARLAVAQERTRFARDLHDLLGHTLSVIALKSELAGRLLPERPDDAVQEVRSVERIARSALAEVREAVSGYRQPTLDGGIAGARLALSAAGIEADVDRPAVTLDPVVEAVLAWAVREGATNVIRHSGATRCTMRVRASLSDAAVEVVDDGVGDATSNGNGGHGLAGLAERAQDLRGSVDAGSRPEGGFRLSVTVPVGAA